MNQLVVSSQSLPSLRIEDCVNEEKQELLESLKIRKEALEDALNKKLAELKALCLKEGELTGELPPEIPLNPREPLPQIRKRVRTEFQLDNKLLEVHNENEEALPDLELQIEIQSKIVEATLKLCNEENVKRAVKKKRKELYNQAVAKLKDLEQMLCASRRNSCRTISSIKVESRKTKDVMEDAISNSTNVSSGLSIVTDDDEDNKKSKENSARSATSAPSTPVIKRERSRKSPHMTSFVPISPPNKRSLKPSLLRPSSEVIPFTSETSTVPQRCRTVDRICQSPEYDQISISSGGSNTGVTRVQNLTNLRTSEINKAFPPVDKNSFTVPTRRSSRHPTSHDDSILKAKNSVPNVAITASSNHISNLRRHNSLENSRRKSYIAATQPYPLSLNQNNHSNHRAFPKHDKQCAPAPSKLPSGINMAQRPLPPTPDSKESLPSPPLSAASLAKKSKRGNDSNNNNSERDNKNFGIHPGVPHLSTRRADGKASRTHESETRTAPVRMTWKEAEAAITCRPVRSSIVRTPFTINISNSSDASQYSNTKAPSPAPTLPPRTPTTPCPSNITNNFPICELDVHQPPSTPTPTLQNKRWVETSIDDVPIVTRKPPSSKASSVMQDSPAESVIDELDSLNQRQQSDTISLREVRRNMTTPRPMSIPLSPTLPAPNAGMEVNVLSVGHFQPYWEETKPYELSDFYKYSTKHRKNKDCDSNSGAENSIRDGGDRESVVVSPASHLNGSCIEENSKVKNLNVTLNDSFITKAAVSEAFQEEMYEWYEDEVKKATLV